MIYRYSSYTIIIFNDNMDQQQIQLRLLHEKHINNLLALQHQRELLQRENPYKQTFYQQTEPKRIDYARIPILKTDPFVQKLLYYPPSDIQGKVAGKAINNILDSWNKECSRFPDNIHLDKMLRYDKSLNLQGMLSRKGIQQIKANLKYARKNYLTRPHITIKEKYGQSFRGTFLKDTSLGISNTQEKSTIS